MFTSFLILTSAINLSKGLDICGLWNNMQLSLTYYASRSHTYSLMTVVKGVHGNWAVLCELCVEHTVLIIHVTLD